MDCTDGRGDGIMGTYVGPTDWWIDLSSGGDGEPSPSPSIVTNGLVMHLDAANPESYPGSGSTWYDLSGNGNNGTLVNGPTFDGDNLGSIVFDGTNFVTTGNTLDPIAYGLFADSTSFWSVSSWFKPVGNGAITGKGGGTGGVATYVVWMRSGTILSTRLRGGTILNISNSITSNWYEVSITWDGTTARAYLNDEFVSTISVGTRAKQSNNFTIGATASGNNTRYNGNVSNVKVYNRALTAEEIQQNFNAQRGRYDL
jgi:hypothetical protein